MRSNIITGSRNSADKRHIRQCGKTNNRLAGLPAGAEKENIDMGINGITGNASTPLASAPTSANHGAATTPAAANPVVLQPTHDTVKLTGVALAKSLKLAGQTPAQIAVNMGMPVKTIDGYLGVKVQTAAVATPQPTTPAPQAKQAASVPAPAPQPKAPEATEPAKQKVPVTVPAKK